MPKPIGPNSAPFTLGLTTKTKHRWRPRHGQPLSATTTPSRLEMWFCRLLKRLPKWLIHPAWAICLGALLSISGHDELLLRGIGLFLVAVWLSIDLWAKLLPQKRKWKFVLG